jgi:hypothetical protein
MKHGLTMGIFLMVGCLRSFGGDDMSFCGSTPCGGAIREVLRIPADADAELIEWKLTLYKNPSRYELRCEYGLTTAGKPGLTRNVKTLERQGTWTMGKGIRSNPEAVIYELNGAMALLEVDANVLHVLNRDRSLMIGTGGWSYTLNRIEHSEKPPDKTLELAQPDMSYKISELATGPTVFGVFEGRTPCLGIARELKSSVHGGCNKVKWRVTLYQNPQTRAPTTYKIEGSLYRPTAREGTWSLTRGTHKDPNATVYQLSPTKTEPALFLLKGDDNVLFFLDQARKSRVGHCEFSYTLNRRSTVAEAPQTQ